MDWVYGASAIAVGIIATLLFELWKNRHERKRCNEQESEWINRRRGVKR